ncbi:MAG TPA: Fic family protein [Polyangiaceae bacterium]|jgi:Fic family protein
MSTPSPTRAGHFLEQNAGSTGSYHAFVPSPLPPSPPLELDIALRDAEAQANLAVGRLDGASRLLPDLNLFLYMYIRKEAVLSSQIEGTQSSLSDLLLFENAGAPAVPLDDVTEVSRYVRALDHGVRRLAELPVSMRLLREMHRELVTGARGGDKTPGDIRTSQNWIGGTRPGNAHFVPPPPHLLGELLSNLEKFLHDDPERTPTLLKAGIAHAQLETIHPFLDGNGRLGRLLIALVLVAEGVLHAPLLYMSLHFKEHREEYYERLQRIRTHGEWEAWVLFYLEGVGAVADQATQTAAAVMHLFETDRGRIVASAGKAAQSALQVFDVAKKKAALSIPEAARSLELTQPTVNSAVKLLVTLGVLREVTGKQRDRQFLYGEYVELLSHGPKLG